jgi:conjugal transfer pilus assembly protein TraF
MTNFKILIILLSLINVCFAESWASASQKGWLWYKRTPKPKSKIEEEKPAKVAETLSYRQQAKKVREQFEEIQAKAVLHPTLENVQALQQAQEKTMNQATTFQEMWMLTSMLSGGYRESDQPFPQHRQIYKDQQDQQLDQKIRELAKTFGLFFVFKRDCPYCHQFAPIVRQFISQYGFDYKAISPDGEPLSEFPDAVADNGTIRSINPEGVYPMLFLVNPHTRQVIPLARGLVNLDHLKDNCKTIIQTIKG